MLNETIIIIDYLLVGYIFLKGRWKRNAQPVIPDIFFGDRNKTIQWILQQIETRQKISKKKR